MRTRIFLLPVLAAFIWALPTQAGEVEGLNAPCAGNPDAIGTSRVLEVDTSDGPRYGSLQYAGDLGLEAGEIVLTFDDGPSAAYTPQVLDILDAHCAKATFFVVGLWAAQSPGIVRDAYRRGHTIANHTWSHPVLSRVAPQTGVEQIEKGFAGARHALASIAAEAPYGGVAPFFRFPGLHDTAYLKIYLKSRSIAVFSGDMGASDWNQISTHAVYHRGLRNIVNKGKGVLVLHDTHARTAEALPMLLKELKRRGFRIVHLKPKAPPEPAALVGSLGE